MKIFQRLLGAAGALVLGGTGFAQGSNYTLLHQFAGGAGDGATPTGSLARSGSALFGMTSAGGPAGLGTIFKVNTDGTGFAVLHSFAGGSADGASPYGSLTLSGSVLYGMTFAGGANSLGTVFKVNADGSGFAVLHSFAGGTADGSQPYGSLVLSGATLYGLTSLGGSSGAGVVFKLAADGTGFALLHAFAGGTADGANPHGSLTLDGATLHGLTANGGDFASGTVFQIGTDGTGYVVQHSFGGGSYGGHPVGSLILSGATLHGMTPAGTGADHGTAFQMNVDGTGFGIVKAFTVGSVDGADPRGSLTLAGATLFGLTSAGGSHDAGTVFTLSGGFALLYAFGGPGDGSQPLGDLTPSDTGATLYGMTSGGGTAARGTVFAFTPSGPLLTAQPSDRQVGAGGLANFAVTVSGPVTYQWQRQAAGSTTWANLSDGGAYGGTGSYLLGVSPVASAMNGDAFRCVVDNSFGEVVSAAATLTVVSGPTVTAQPSVQTHYYLSYVDWFKISVSFTAASANLNEAWESSTDGGATWSPAGSGSTADSTPFWATYTDTLTVNVPYSQWPQEMPPTLYRCVITNDYGAVTCQTVTLSLGLAVNVTSQPASRSATAGNSALFSVTAAGWSALTYRWQRQAAGGTTWSDLSETGSYVGTNTATLSVNPVTAAMGGDAFRCVVDDSYGEQISAVATLTVTDAVVLTGAPASQSVVAGNNATFAAAATGVPPLAYQWQRQAAGSTTWSNLADGGAYSGTGTGTLTVAAPTTAMSGDLFRCVISNSFGTSTSAPAALVVPVPLTISTLAGQGGHAGGTDGAGIVAQFSGPADIAVDAAGNAYVADANNDTVRKVTPAGTVATVAGYTGTSGSADGTGTAARFNHPSGVAVDAGGNIYVADTDNDTVRKIVAGGMVTTVAGQAGSSGSADGTGSAARFNGPSGLAVDAAGNLYVADTLNHTVRKITPAGVVSTVAGAAGVAGSVDGTGTAARFYGLQGMTLDGTGGLCLADTNNSTVRRIDLSSGAVTTLAGMAGINGSVDAPGSMARFYYPSAVAADGSGNLFVTDTDNNTLRMISASGLVSTVAGKAAYHGNAPDDPGGSSDGVGDAARFFHPSGIAVDGAGNLLIADTNNQTIRLGYYPAAPAITAQPQSQAVTAGSNVQFAVAVTGHPAPALQWYLNGAAISGATGATLSLAGVQATNAGDYTVTATNTYGSAASSKATLTVNAVPSVSASVAAGGGGGGGGGATEAWFLLALLGLGFGRRAERLRDRARARRLAAIPGRMADWRRRGVIGNLEAHMPDAIDTTWKSDGTVPRPVQKSGPGDDGAGRDAPRHCSAATFAAACRLRLNGNPSALPGVVRGVIERQVEPGLRPRLRGAVDYLRLNEDLGLDSLALMEVATLTEDIFHVAISGKELGDIRTVADFNRLLAYKLDRSRPPGAVMPATQDWD
jgi:uncharacterized repeat protein (TIGR03803 family)